MVAAAGVLAGLSPWGSAGHVAAQAVRGELDVRVHSLAFERYDGAPGVRLVRASPVIATLDVTAWDLGVRNLSVHLRTSAVRDLATADAWPVVEPPVRLVEGYVEYSDRRLTARAGRTFVHTRLGYESLDGVRADIRPGEGLLTLTGFGGWSLERGSTLPATSPDANPLSEFRPPERALLLGGLVGAAIGPLRATGVYRREFDPSADRPASEFVAISASARMTNGLGVAAGADYDLGYAEWGSADARLGWHGRVEGRRVGVAASVRRYRPRFPYWSIWGAFSPVAHTTIGLDASVSALDDLQLRGAAERFTYAEAGTSSPLTRLEDDGWRWSAGAGWGGLRDWSFDVEFGAEFGPGASSTFARGAAGWEPVDRLRIGAWLSRGTRPLEYRIDDAIVHSAGIGVALDLADDLALEGGLAWYDEDREGGEARRFDYVGVRAGIRYGFGTSPDRTDLHPSILRIPEKPDP